MTNAKDFRPFVPTIDYPRVAAFQGRDAYQHGDAGLANPIPQELLFKPWEKLYSEPFKGITTDGQPIANLFSKQSQNAPIVAMLQSVHTLLKHLNADQKKALCLPIDAREWRRWNNTEMYIYRYGLRLEEITETNKNLILKVISSSLSDAGFKKTRDVMKINHFLGELTGNTKVLGEWSFNFTLFGEPSPVNPWGWQLMGHHLAINCLIIGDQMVLSPSFMGAEPNHIDAGPNKGIVLFEDEEFKGLSFIQSLTEHQKAQAILFHSCVGGDLPEGRRHKADQLHLTGALQDNRVIPYEGIQGKELSTLQRTQLLRLIETYLAPLPAGPQKARLDEVESYLAETYFSWIGGTGENDTFYYRIHSPVLMIEFDHHSGVFLTNQLPAKFHIHTIVRTPNGGDYGIDLLKLHYQQEHDHRIKPGVAGGPIHHHGHSHGHGHTHNHDHGHTHDHENN